MGGRERAIEEYTTLFRADSLLFGNIGLWDVNLRPRVILNADDTSLLIIQFLHSLFVDDTNACGILFLCSFVLAKELNPLIEVRGGHVSELDIICAKEHFKALNRRHVRASSAGITIVLKVAIA